MTLPISPFLSRFPPSLSKVLFPPPIPISNSYLQFPPPIPTSIPTSNSHLCSYLLNPPPLYLEFPLLFPCPMLTYNMLGVAADSGVLCWDINFQVDLGADFRLIWTLIWILILSWFGHRYLDANSRLIWILICELIRSTRFGLGWFEYRFLGWFRRRFRGWFGCCLIRFTGFGLGWFWDCWFLGWFRVWSGLIWMLILGWFRWWFLGWFRGWFGRWFLGW